MKFVLTLFAVSAINVCFAQQKPDTTNPGNAPKKSNAVSPVSEKKADSSNTTPSKEKEGISNKIAVSDQGVPAKKSGAKKPVDKDKAIVPQKTDTQKKSNSPK